MKLTKLFALSAVLAPVLFAATLSPDAIAGPEQTSLSVRSTGQFVARTSIESSSTTLLSGTDRSAELERMREEMEAQTQLGIELQQEMYERMREQRAADEAEFRAQNEAALAEARDNFTIEAPDLSITPELSFSPPPIFVEQNEDEAVIPFRSMALDSDEDERELVNADTSNDEAAEAIEDSSNENLADIAESIVSSETPVEEVAAETETTEEEVIANVSETTEEEEGAAETETTEEEVVVNESETSDEEGAADESEAVTSSVTSNTEIAATTETSSTVSSITEGVRDIAESVSNAIFTTTDEEVVADESETTEEEVVADESEATEEEVVADVSETTEEEVVADESETTEEEVVADESETTEEAIEEQVDQIVADSSEILEEANQEGLSDEEKAELQAAITDEEEQIAQATDTVEEVVEEEEKETELNSDLANAQEELDAAKALVAERDSEIEELVAQKRSLTNAYCEQKNSLSDLTERMEAFENESLGGLNNNFNMLAQLMMMNILAQQGAQQPRFELNPGLNAFDPRVAYHGLENGIRLASLNDLFRGRHMSGMMSGPTNIFNVTGDFYGGPYTNNPIQGSYYSGDYSYQGPGSQTGLRFPTVNASGPFTFDFAAASAMQDGPRYSVAPAAVRAPQIEQNVQTINGGGNVFQRRVSSEELEGARATALPNTENTNQQPTAEKRTVIK